MCAIIDQRRCKVCGEAIVEDRKKARAGMSARHHIQIEQSETKPLCKGSKIRFSEQSALSDPWEPTPSRPVPKTWALTEVKSTSPLNKTLARLPASPSVTYVDFLEARVERALGHPTTGAAALRFVRVDFRNAPIKTG